MPRKEELARMTPEKRERYLAQRRLARKPRTAEQRERENAARRNLRQENPERFAAERKAFYERHPDRKRHDNLVITIRERARRERAAAEAHDARLRAVAERLCTQQAMAALYRRIERALPRCLPPAERVEAASVLFLSIMDGRRPIDFGPADVKAAVTEMDRFNEPLNSVSLSDDFGDRSRGETLGLY